MIVSLRRYTTDKKEVKKWTKAADALNLDWSVSTMMLPHDGNPPFVPAGEVDGFEVKIHIGDDEREDYVEEVQVDTTYGETASEGEGTEG